MSSVTKSANGKFWLAGFRDHSGKRINRATRVPSTNRYRIVAEDIASFWEEIAKGEISEKNLIVKKSIIEQKIKKRMHGIGVEGIISAFSRTTDAMCSSEYGSKRLTSFRDLTEKWLNHIRLHVAKGSYTSYKHTVDEFLDFLKKKADSPLENFDRDWIRSYVNMKRKNLSDSSVNKKTKCIGRVLRWGFKQDYLDVNHADKLTYLKSQPASTRRPFSEEELRKILDYCDEEWSSMVKMGYTTGQRLGDIANAKWSDIDTENWVWKFVVQKTERALELPLIDDFVDVLRKIPLNKRNGFVHTRAHKLYNSANKQTSTLSNQFSKILLKAGIRKGKISHKSRNKGRNSRREEASVGFHCLRVTTATLLHENGASQSIAQAILGHSCSAVHNLYVKPRTAPMRKEIEKLSLF